MTIPQKLTPEDLISAYREIEAPSEEQARGNWDAITRRADAGDLPAAAWELPAPRPVTARPRPGSIAWAGAVVAVAAAVVAVVVSVSLLEEGAVRQARPDQARFDGSKPMLLHPVDDGDTMTAGSRGVVIPDSELTAEEARPAEPPAEPEPEMERSPRPAVDPASPRSAPASAPEDAEEARSVLGPAVAAEAAHLGRARAALRDGDPQGALTELRRYSDTFPSGVLAEEAAVLRVVALCEAGQAEQARTRARAFLQRYPASPAGGVVKQVCPEPVD